MKKLVLGIVVGFILLQYTFAQQVSITLDEAIQIALENSYQVQSGKIDLADAKAQIDEAYVAVYPQINLSSSYTRNIVSANPFSGSDAGNLFSGLGQLDWLAYNERARTDDDDATLPISLSEFRQKQSEGLNAAGIDVSSSDNPFAVPNQLQNSISITHTLYNYNVRMAMKASRTFEESANLGFNRQQQQVINNTAKAYYQALLVQEQAEVLQKSIDRTKQTVEEAGKLVEQGVAPKFQRLSAEVELGNLETQFIQVENQVENALNNLKLTIGLPVSQSIKVLGSLDKMAQVSEYENLKTAEALQIALANRPDLKQLNRIVALQDINRELTKGAKYPIVNAFANLGLSASIPSDRTTVLSDPNDPFTFTEQKNSIFSDSYWNPSVAVGVRLNWTIFDGGLQKVKFQRATLAKNKSEIQQTQLEQGIELEVEMAHRGLLTARERIINQERNIDRAALNYEYAHARLKEGVGTQLEERQASELLDQSRLAYVQSVYDYLVALSNFETAIGITPTITQ